MNRAVSSRCLTPSCRLTLVGLLTLALALPASAQQTRQSPIYDVEVVIFAYTGANAGGEELWPARLLLPQLAGVVELLPPPLRVRRPGIDESPTRLLDDEAFDRLSAVTPTTASAATTQPLRAVTDPASQFELLDPRSYRLQKEVERLDRSGRYRVLWHLAWRQPGLPAEQAVAIHVRAGDPTELPLIDLTAAVDFTEVLDQAGVIEVPGPFAETAWLDAVIGQSLPPRVLIPPDPRQIRIYPLDGSLRLEMGRYLHLYTDLILTQAVGILPARAGRGLRGAGVEALQSFPVRSHRRMRSGELHHLDHPVLGLLVLTTRLAGGQEVSDAQTPEPEAGVSEDEALPDPGTQ